MAKRVFAVVLDEPSDTTLDALKQAYDTDFYQVNDLVGLVRTDALSAVVAEKAGFKDDGPASGVVFKLNRSYSGFTYRGLWEWLSEVEGEGK